MDDMNGSENLDVDSLLSEVDSSPGYEIPMGDEPAPAQAAPTQQAPTPAAAPAAPQAPQMHTITWNGKQIQGTMDQLQKWAQQGYDYSQKMQEYKAQQEALNPYKEIDEYARQNPEWWNHVSQSYEQRAQAMGLDANNPLLRELNSVKQELGEIKNFKQTLEQKEIAQQRMAEDQALEQSVKSMREKYSHLDWTTPDASGYDLEHQVLKFANENNIGNFDAAFKAYNHDRLMSIAIEQGKEAVAKNIQKNSKLGLLGKSPAPQKQVRDTNVRGKSYDQLMREGLEELGIQ